MQRLRLMLIVVLIGTPRLALAVVLYSEGFDSSAADVKINQSINSAVDYVDYSNFTVGATNFIIPEAPNNLAGSTPTQGVLMRVNHTGPARREWRSGGDQYAGRGHAHQFFW